MQMRDEAGKIFVGGLSWNTNQQMMKGYFSRFGEIVDCVVMKNPQTGKSRGFGFVTFKDPSVVEVVLAQKDHVIDGRGVDAKACNTKAAQVSKVTENKHQNRSSIGRTNKIFIGGIPNGVDEDMLKTIFGRYGPVTEVLIMYDQQKGRSRGFGFLTFETEESVNEVCKEHYVDVNGKKVECKRAEPRTGGGGGFPGGGPGGRRPRGPPGSQGPPFGQQEPNWGGPGGGNWNQSPAPPGPGMNSGPPGFQQPNMGFQQGGFQQGGFQQGGSFQQSNGYGNQGGGGGYQPGGFQQGWGQQPPPGQDQPPQQVAPGAAPGYGGYGNAYGGQQVPAPTADPYAQGQPPAQQAPAYGGVPPPAQGGPPQDPNAAQPGASYNYGGSNYGYTDPSGYGAAAAAGPQAGYGGGDVPQQSYGGSSGGGYGQRQSQGGAQGYHPYRR